MIIFFDFSETKYRCCTWTANRLWTRNWPILSQIAKVSPLLPTTGPPVAKIPTLEWPWIGLTRTSQWGRCWWLAEVQKAESTLPATLTRLGLFSLWKGHHTPEVFLWPCKCGQNCLPPWEHEASGHQVWFHPEPKRPSWTCRSWCCCGWWLSLHSINLFLWEYKSSEKPRMQINLLCEYE